MSVRRFRCTCRELVPYVLGSVAQCVHCGSRYEVRKDDGEVKAYRMKSPPRPPKTALETPKTALETTPKTALETTPKPTPTTPNKIQTYVPVRESSSGGGIPPENEPHGQGITAVVVLLSFLYPGSGQFILGYFGRAFRFWICEFSILLFAFVLCILIVDVSGAFIGLLGPIIILGILVPLLPCIHLFSAWHAYQLARGYEYPWGTWLEAYRLRK